MDIDKVIVTNAGALTKKHRESGMKKIRAALERMIRADAKRGLITRVIAIDRASNMRGVGRRVTRAHNARQVKRAIDDIYRSLTPDFIMLLGAPDVIPHQRLRNPIHRKDEEKFVASDLPYACDAPYSVEARRFLGPTRVVGRLPDVAGVGDTDHLVTLLDYAATWKCLRRRAYSKVFGLTTVSWRASTARSLRVVWGDGRVAHQSPPRVPPWRARDLSARFHFFNCHGEEGTDEFSGETRDESDQPVAFTSDDARAGIARGTVVAAECCYGAELYRPVAGDPTGICHAYLDEGATGFFGSTTIAWGEPRRQNFADILCSKFASAILSGASTGRATLLARQQYIGVGGYMEVVDLKTLAQFILLGDPSVQPVTPRKTKASPAENRSRRRARRKSLTRGGKALARTTASVNSTPDARADAPVKQEIARRAARDFNARVTGIDSFKLHAPSGRVHAQKGRDLVRKGTVFHVVEITESPASPRARKKRVSKRRARRRKELNGRLLVAREEAGRITRVVEAVRH